MRQVKLLLFILSVLMVAVACSSAAASNEQGMAEPISFDQTKTISASFSNTMLPGMKGIAENEHLQLLIQDETAEIAIFNKKTGKAWFSNPENRELDMLASGVNKDMLSAQLKLDYYNSFGQISSINTYSDAVIYEQTELNAIENGVAVTYKFGTEVRSSADLPLRLSSERFEEISSQLDKAGQRALLIAYRQDKNTGNYDRNDGALQGLQLERALSAFDAIGYTAEDLIRDAEEHNLVQEKEEARIFYATIEYTLDENNLVVRVPVEKILFPDEYPINMISVLPFLGAGDAEAEGSLFVPDGSGALIHFNNGKQRYASYQQTVYGEDMTTERTENINAEQKVRLPVFGMINNNQGWLGIIEEGAAAATINADISGRLNSYNAVYSSFYVVNKGDITLNANDQRRTVPKFQQSPMNSDFVIRYVFLEEKEASYVHLAQAYQHYLLANNLLKKSDEQLEESNLPFYLDVVGGIKKQKNVLGIPYLALEALTTVEQAKEITNELIKQDINNISLRYSGWFNGGLDHAVPTKIKVDGVIGGQSAFKQFIHDMNSKGINVYPDAALLVAHSDKNLKVRKEVSRSLRETPAIFYPINLALDRRDRTKLPSYVISPHHVPTLAKTTSDFLTKHNIKQLSLRDLGDLLNSDYQKKKPIDRTESETISKDIFNQLAEAQFELLVDGGNAYVFPYASEIVNAPMSSSGFKITDESIPFYQQVVRGYIDYTGSPYNLSTYYNQDEYKLRLLEYGSGVHFKWIYADNESVKDTDNNDLYAMNYKLWLDEAVSIYHEVNTFLSTVSNEKMVNHEKLADRVYKTTYENGQYVIVNYNKARVNVEGKAIEAMGYLTGGDAT